MSDVRSNLLELYCCSGTGLTELGDYSIAARRNRDKLWVRVTVRTAIPREGRLRRAVPSARIVCVGAERRNLGCRQCYYRLALLGRGERSRLSAERYERHEGFRSPE